MSRPRIYLRSEGWYFLFVVLFVLGGAVLRHVNLLVALAGLMVAILFIHYQLLVHSLARLDVLRILPARICAGDSLAVEVVITNEHARGQVFALEFREEIQRLVPLSPQSSSPVSLLFPEVAAKNSASQRYDCTLSQRGVYRFHHAELLCRYPFGLMEGRCRLEMPDSLVVCPRLGHLHRAWHELLESEHAGQQRSRHRRGLLEADFYALREWRNGDSRRWIHWRTSAKLGTLAVRQFEQRRSCELALVCDLWQPPASVTQHQEVVEEVISFAATVITDLVRQGNARLTFLLAGQTFRSWHATASTLVAHEMLEQLAVCEATQQPDLVATEQLLNEYGGGGEQVVVLSTRARPPFSKREGGLGKSNDRLRQAIWLNAAAQECQRYFSAEAPTA